ncbi:cell wall-binding repeat-containing protein (plasmid) [Rossellomorea sp. AcN35-11]|nr:cell wall-binding repeat-containing protein [Rossellomorea aquimaris]WJV32077.1 cell wall-binding repeat-containing protein [Rossellomorea sp. AcN35-11]
MKFTKFLGVSVLALMAALPNAAHANGGNIGYCEMTITKKDVGIENAVDATNHCKGMVYGYYGGGNFHITGLTTSVVDYSGQKFEVTSLTSSNMYEVLTVYIEDGSGKVPDAFTRLSGQTRLDTAIEVSKEGWPNGLQSAEKSVILARADNPADALAASSLSGVKDAPILLTYSSNVDQSVLNELARLNAKKVYLLGGSVAIHQGVETKLANKGYVVERISGSTRFETAARINEEAGTSNNSKAIIANGYSVADALSASADAAINGVPIYLANKGDLPVNLPSSVTSVDVYGGSAVISDGVVSQLKSKGISVNRIAGSNRYTTSIAGAENLKGSSSNIILVRGKSVNTTKEDYPDAVAASALAHKLDAKILLVHPWLDVAETKAYLQGKNHNVYVLGGEAAISQDVLKGLGL